VNWIEFFGVKKTDEGLWNQTKSWMR